MLAAFGTLLTLSTLLAEDVSVEQVLASPRHFDGKRISLVGYYVIANEESCLFTTRAAAKRADFKHSIWIDFPGGSDLTAIAGRDARLVGRFHYIRDFDPKRGLGYGQWGLWSCTLQNVASFRPLR